MRVFRNLRGLALAVAMLIGATALADEKESRSREMVPDQPGPVHEAVTRRAGEYDTVSKFRANSDSAPTETKGTAKLISVMDGRFMLEESTSSLFGKPVKGLRLVGYNGRTKQYEATWTYSMATGMMSLTGTSSDGGKTIEWTENNPAGRGAKSPLHIITRYIDDDNFAIEMVNRAPDGKIRTSLETTYTRRRQ
jgi:hypothetical protein